ncbi:sucrase/ferredoxin domain-containing protein [Periconia macrospinosa]|uniref:Defect at low temperature protein 1 n=1 Tax=Periconia macrospinosa TaxID=97972 RepID=A0A2V1DLE2_9PLEO|nr:sucrase/ferredoxin domain-containing protein [Periconia macrospinosa]
MRIPTLFRIWYSTTYTVLFIILIILLAISPADTIYQSVRTNAIQKIFVIGGVYVLTIAIILLIYSTRLYTNRSVLAAIPKPYLPIEDGEVGTLVRRMIVKALRRSAVVAWDSRPRDIRGEIGSCTEGEADTKTITQEKGHHKKRQAHPPTIIPISTKCLPWGHVSHPGWASPASPDLPNLHYNDVVKELPNLIEAKAVSLAPPDPAVEGHAHHVGDTPMLPDARIVSLLQRPRTMGLREYLARLSSFGLLNPPSLGLRFLSLYEHARFSTYSLGETDFREIMDVFAEILNGMTELDVSVIEAARAEPYYDSDTRSLAPSTITSFSSSSTPSYNSSHADPPYTTPMIDRLSDFSFNGTGSPQTARSELSLGTNSAVSSHGLFRTPSGQSAASEQGSVRRNTVQRSPSTILPQSSSSSLRSQGSVIRLRTDPAEGETPYEYRFEAG